MTTNNPDKEDRQNKGLDHDASRHGGDEPRRQAAPDADDPRNGVPSVGRGLDEERDSTSDQEKFGSGTPGDQGTYSVVGAQPDGGAGGLGSQVQSGDGSPRDIAEAGGNPQHRNAPAPELGEAAESASESYEQTEYRGSALRPGSGDRNTAGGSSSDALP